MKLSICFTVDSVEFTAGVIAGTTSLGGSESACLGLARALQARGHDVHIFATKLAEDAPQVDHGGVTWHNTTRLEQWAIYKDWDVAVALRQPAFLPHISAKYRILWAQDLMAPGDSMKGYVMSLAWSYDAVAYVSRYHQKQWEDRAPELAGIGWATKNGHDAALAAEARKSAVKKPNQIIHISRPERGLSPLLQMWPEIRKARPDATLALCRYSSMYDPQGWGSVCQTFDEMVAAMQAEVGGIEWLGELGKPDLYRAIAESAVMWYPGVATFAETSCIAAIESQACGTPFVGSWKGALPETVPSGVLIPGDADTPAYQEASVAAVLKMLDGCAAGSFAYRQAVNAGREHVVDYSYEAVAAEWDAYLMAAFHRRYETQKVNILHRLDHDDDMVTAKIVAAELAGTAHAETAARIDLLADRVIAGLEHTAENYATHALDPMVEIAAGGARQINVVSHFEGCQRIFDAACGNGSFAILLAQADPNRRVTAVDFSEANIIAARKAAEAVGVGDRIEFICAPVWDMDTQQPSAWLQAQPSAAYDGLFCGEFIEHVADCSTLVASLERLVKHMGRLVWTCPFGPLSSLCPRTDPLQRSHVHHFRPADLEAVFGQKNAYTRLALPWQNQSARGEAVGQWIVTYRCEGPTGTRPFDRRILQRPYLRLSAGIIANTTLDIRRCLDAIWPYVDEIVIGDCGLRPMERDALLAEFTRKVRVIDVGAVADLPGGFSEARNRVLAETTGDWFLWIDTDEILCGQAALGKYLDGPVFNGYVVPQNHLYLDAAMGTDIPIRVFRRRPEIAFYGCIHEQPQWQDCNGDITPALRLADVQIAHTGYLHEGIRREKAITRNLPLLVRDQQVFPERELGTVLVLRDHANIAKWGQEANGGQLTENGRYHYGQVVALFEAHFADPTHRYHSIARPFYEAALREVNGAIEIELGMVGAVNGLGKTHATAQRVWARTPAQVRALLTAQIDAMLAPLEHGPEPIDVEPIVAPAQVAV